jgi:hypothetical protein
MHSLTSGKRVTLGAFGQCMNSATSCGGYDFILGGIQSHPSSSFHNEFNNQVVTSCKFSTELRSLKLFSFLAHNTPDFLIGDGVRKNMRHFIFF